MDLWQALILGLVEGVTEYLPVSSTGHLLVAQRLLGIEPSEAANAYAIAIQAGAIAAVLGLYRARVGQMLRGLVGRDRAGVKLLGALGVAFLPAAILGIALDESIEAALFGPWPIIGAWIAGGILILAVARRLPRQGGLPIESIGPRVAFLVGCAQCIAMWPGVSRSLATILGGLAVGLSMAAAVEFSFLLGLITLGAATAYKTVGSGAIMVQAYGPLPLAVGFLAACLFAVVAVRWMVSWLQSRGLELFGWWRLVVAGAATALILVGWL